MGQNLKGNGHVQQNVSRIENKLSVDLELDARHTGIPTLVLQQIWSKATYLLMSNQVTMAPGCPNFARMVASKSKNQSRNRILSALVKMATISVMKHVQTSTIALFVHTV